MSRLLSLNISWHIDTHRSTVVYLSKQHYTSSTAVEQLRFHVPPSLRRKQLQQPKQAERQNELAKPEKLTTQDMVLDANSIYTSRKSRCYGSNATLRRKCDGVKCTECFV